MMKFHNRYAALFAVLPFLPCTLGAIVSLESFVCDKDQILQIENVALSCNGVSECKMGHVSTLDGQLTLTEDLDSDEIYVDARLEKFHVPLINLYHHFPTEFCAETTSMTGSDCPNQGAYKFSADVTIPHISNFVTGWTVTAKATFFDDHDVLVGKCEIVVSTESSWGGNATSTSVAVLGGLCMVGLFVRRRRRRLSTLEEESEGEGSGQFTMMTDQIELARKNARDFNKFNDPIQCSRFDSPRSASAFV